MIRFSKYEYLKKCILVFFQAAEYQDIEKFIKKAQINDWITLGIETKKGCERLIEKSKNKLNKADNLN